MALRRARARAVVRHRDRRAAVAAAAGELARAPRRARLGAPRRADPAIVLGAARGVRIMPAIGLFVDLRRLPDSRRSPAAHVTRTIELLAHAESLGRDSAWFTEHHAFPDGYLPQPLVLAAAVAARTSRLR